jgi:hypothetical protein
MSKLNINIGSKANDKAGDTLRTAFDKINLNFTELYTLTGGTSTALTELAQDYAAPMFNHASHTNITATYDDANNKILLTGAAAQVQSNWTASSGLGVILNKPTLFSGSYTDLTNKPTIPTSFSSLVNGANTVSLDSNSNLTFTNGEQIKTNFLGGGIELYQSSDNTIGIYPGGAEIKTFTTGGPKYKWFFGVTGNTTFPTGLVLGAPRGVNTVNFTCSVDKEFQIETGTASAGRLWQFGTAGNTTFPSGLTLHRLSTPYSNITADLDKILQIATQTSGGRKEWTFGTNGSLTLPIGVSIDNNVDPLYPKIIADSGKLFSVQGQGTSGSAALSWTVNPAAAGQYAAVAVSRAGGDNLAKVVIQAQSNSGDVGTAKTWKFDETGNLTFPNNTVQTTAWTGIPGPYADDTAAAAANVAVGYPYHKTGTGGQVFVRLT